MVGDATVDVDELLVKHALSDLLGNATRFAEPGSTLQVCIESGSAGGGPVDGGRNVAPEVGVVVRNRGPEILPQQLPRLFDRFFRGDESRCCDGDPHHGLGLAVAAAIARVDAGRMVARSHDGVTDIGFTVAPHPSAA